MNLPEYSLRSAKVIWFFLFVLLTGGALGFATLGKKEDSAFVIKIASMVCSYPGATPQQVEELVTEPIEREVQSMRRVHKITSESYYGLSKIQVELDPATPAAEIPQLWDELRRKVLNVQPRLPAGASAVTVAVPLERALTVTRFPVTVLAALLVTLPRDRTLASLTDHTAFRPVERRRIVELPKVRL